MTKTFDLKDYPSREAQWLAARRWMAKVTPAQVSTATTTNSADGAER